MNNRMKGFFIAGIILLLRETIHAQDTLKLPEPFATQSIRKNSRVIGWPADKKPIAPAGFEVTLFAKGLANPRWLYVAPNGDLFVAESGTKIPKNKRDEELNDFFKTQS